MMQILQPQIPTQCQCRPTGANGSIFQNDMAIRSITIWPGQQAQHSTPEPLNCRPLPGLPGLSPGGGEAPLVGRGGSSLLHSRAPPGP